jgi:hypothetical protein
MASYAERQDEADELTALRDYVGRSGIPVDELDLGAGMASTVQEDSLDSLDSSANGRRSLGR